MAIPQIIKSLANDIRTKIKGKEVRESLARGIEEAGNIADESNSRSKDTESRQGVVETQFDNVLAEWSDDKPVDNAETIAGRTNRKTGKSYSTIGKRLDEEKDETTTSIIQSTGHGVLETGELYGDLRVASRATPNMTVNVYGGTVHMPNGEKYTFNSPTVLDVPPSDPTKPRRDIVYVSDSGQISYLQGSTEIEEAPNVPEGGFLLAEIGVPEKASEIVGRNVYDRRIIKKNNIQISEELVKFKNISNTDGAVTNLINTGLTYTGVDDFVYGNSHTLFNDAAKINGKWQIDCSSFVQACLEGVSFGNSKYVNGENIRQDSPFLFPDEAKSPTDGRMLANDLAKYALEMGWAYEPLEDYSNVRVGDVIFWHNSPQPNFWRGIGHVQIVINTSRKGYITVLHSYENAEKAVQMDEYTFEQLRNRRAFTCARFPLKYAVSRNKLISTNPNRLYETDTQLVRPIELVEPWQERQMYTVIMRLNPDNPDAYPLIRLLGDRTAYSFWDKNRKPNGTYKASFFIPKDGLKNVENLYRANLHLANHPGGRLGYFGIYKGYVTEFNELDDLTVTERGMNSNGTYTKYPDGTLICTHTHTWADMLPTIREGALFKSNPKEWVYPHAFIEEPIVIPKSNFSAREATLTNTPTDKSCRVGLLSAIQSDQPGSVFLYAYGRWK